MMETKPTRRALWRGLLCAMILALWGYVLGCEIEVSPKEPPKEVGSDAGPRETLQEQPKELKDPKKLGLIGLCPGAKGCLHNEGTLMAGAAAVDVSVKGFEVAHVAYLNEKGFCPPPTPAAPFGLKRCGALVGGALEQRRDCGRDGLCPGDRLRTRLSCEKASDCPAGLLCEVKEKRCYLQHTKPDDDGSEKDGLPDWFLDCGKDRICPCLDPKGAPAYFGQGKQCLKGHKTNPQYKAPDADGTEGNGAFDGIWMGGFSSGHPMMGIHDPIWARALVLRSGETTVAIASVDLVGFFRPGVHEVRKQVLQKLPSGTLDYLLISSTHNHEGPDSMGQWGPRKNGLPSKSGVDQGWYQKTLLPGIARAVVQATEGLRPARLFVARTHTGAKGLVRDSRDPVVIDDSLLVLQVLQAADNAPIATLLNWGNHPEVLSDINNYQTSDFAHYIREGLEQGIKSAGIPALGGVGIYLQAAVGGLMTPLGVKVPALDGTLQTQSDWDKARALGHQLVKRAHEALQQKQELKAPKVSFWAKEVKVRVENILFRIVFAFGLFDRQPVDFDPSIPIGPENYPKIATEIALIRVGDATFFSMPGELEPSLLLGGYTGAFRFGADLIQKNNKHPPDLSKAPKGPYLKSRIPGKYKFFVGLGNDQLGYILPRYNFVVDEKRPYFAEAPGDHYEETNSLGPQTAPALLEAYGALLQLIP